MKFEFDPAKNAANLEKHGLSLGDAGLVYGAPGKLTLNAASANESRYMDVALVDKGGVVLVLVYTLRRGVVRVISLRRASRQERRLYESWKEN